MMRLQTIYEGNWHFVAEVDARGTCAVQDDLDALASSKGTRAVAAGFLALWQRTPKEGPHVLPVESYHRIDAENEIYEFIKGRYRVVCFLADGRMVVSSSVFLKKSQKAPKNVVARAVELRRRFLAAAAAGQIRVVERGAENGE